MKAERILSAARQFFAKATPRDEAKPREPLAEQVRALLDHYSDKVIEREEQLGRGGWLRTPTVDHEAFRQAFELLIEHGREEGRHEASEALVERIGWQCCCTCRTHQRIGCPLCLEVWGCPVHSEVGPQQLRVAVLLDPAALAQEFQAFTGDQLWDELPPAVQHLLVEAFRRIVVARMSQGGRYGFEESAQG